MAAYTTRDVARLLNLPSSKIRSFARAGLTTAARDPRGTYRFSFQDLILLRTAQELSAVSISVRKIYRTLRTLSAQLPAGASLSAVRIVVEHDDVLVQDQQTVWDPATGQAQLNFSIGEMASQVAPLIRGIAQDAELTPDTSDEEWFDMGLDFEWAGAEDDAKAAYVRAVELNPDHTGAHVNLGRLLQQEGRAADAEAHYRHTLSIDPEDATAAFNLGSVLEDLGRRHAAIEAYQQALKIDANLSDAHYNLSALYEDTGNRAAALKHLIRYKALE
ncbi:MAG: tetratricopeptide repeat protein [Gammaproteobacteria bacterium]|nr:tetratricopeptide repeat protein [Gammaproteobacteria bacterium]